MCAVTVSRPAAAAVAMAVAVIVVASLSFVCSFQFASTVYGAAHVVRLSVSLCLHHDDHHHRVRIAANTHPKSYTYNYMRSFLL